jgi:hypothetical protein
MAIKNRIVGGILLFHLKGISEGSGRQLLVQMIHFNLFSKKRAIAAKKYQEFMYSVQRKIAIYFCRVLIGK